MNSIKKFIAVGAFSLLVLGLPAIASAQWYPGQNRDDDYYGNNRYNRNIRGTIQSLKNRARNFERRVDRYDDRNDDRYGNGGYGGYGGWGNRRNNNTDRLENLADQFARATDDLADAYGRGRNMRNSEDEARRVVDIARQIDQALYNSSNSRRGRGVEREWSQIRSDVRTIANVYGINDRYRRNDPNGSWRDRVPFPLPF